MSTRAIRVRQALAILLFAVSAAMVAFAFGSVILPGREQLPEPPSFLAVAIAASVMLAYPLVGALVAIRRPTNRIGWLFLVLGLSFTVSFFSTEYVGRAMISGWPLPAPAAVAWAGSWSFLFSTGIAFVWLPLLFPTGDLPGPRWRWLARVTTLVMVLGFAAAAALPGTVDADYPTLQNPLGVPALAAFSEAIEAVYFPVIALLGLAAIGSLLVRFRRGAAVERAQVKWLLLATGAFFVTIAVGLATEIDGVFVVALVAAAGIPVSAGIAILRYRLWDIDRVVSRTIGWALVTAGIAAVFAVAVIGLQALLAGVTNGQTLAVAASTLIAFALFQPVRRRVQAAVDRRFNRGRYDAERMLAAFAADLRDELDLAALRTYLASTTARAVEPARVDVWIRGAPGNRPAGAP